MAPSPPVSVLDWVLNPQAAEWAWMYATPQEALDRGGYPQLVPEGLLITPADQDDKLKLYQHWPGQESCDESALEAESKLNILI